VVRPHPQNVIGGMADKSWLPRLRALTSKRVAVDFPKMEESQLSWNLASGDLEHLMRLIAGCSICLNSGSTLAIDAILQDKPVILTPFDAADSTISWHRSARRLPEYPHLKKLIKMGGLRCAGNFEELTGAILEYLDSPELDQKERAATRKAQCGPSDGRAAKRVAQALSEICNRGTHDLIGPSDIGWRRIETR